MVKQQIRDYWRLFCSLLFSFLYAPHLLIVIIMDKKMIFSDILRMRTHEHIKLGKWTGLIFFLHTNSYFRTLFYHRIGAIPATLIGWYRTGNRYFTISFTTKIGAGMLLSHPYATILNAESIGENFSCIHCTTLGAKSNGRPVIGDNVSLGASVTIVGHVRIGNNVTIGAGSVVVKDIPDNCIAVGNPCKPVRFLKK